MTIRTMMKHPSAFLPLAMSFLTVTTIAVHLACYGVTRQPDEGAAAHIWQLLMAAQVPIVAFFSIKWLPQSPKQALLVLALQAAAVLAALAPVYLLNW